jgi:tetratricopeptide (TPR) repeat protein
MPFYSESHGLNSPLPGGFRDPQSVWMTIDRGFPQLAYPQLPAPQSPGQKLPPALQIVTTQQRTHVIPKKAIKEMIAGENARAKQHNDQAVLRMNNAIRLDPEFVSARNNLAVLYLRLNNPEPAVAQLEEAIKIDPRNPATVINITVGYICVKRYEAAARTAREALALDRGDNLPKLLLGAALVLQGKFTEEAYRCLQGNGDQYPLSHFLIARILIARNDGEGARAELKKYLWSNKPAESVTANKWLSYIENGKQMSAGFTPP